MEKFPRNALTAITAERPGALNSGRMMGRINTPQKSISPKSRRKGRKQGGYGNGDGYGENQFF